MPDSKVLDFDAPARVREADMETRSDSALATVIVLHRQSLRGISESDLDAFGSSHVRTVPSFTGRREVNNGVDKYRIEGFAHDGTGPIRSG